MQFSILTIKKEQKAKNTLQSYYSLGNLKEKKKKLKYSIPLFAQILKIQTL